MKIIDLSKTIYQNPNDPFFMKVKIKHKTHKKSKWIIRLFGLPFKLFPKHFTGWADDMIKQLGVHATTHLDAPYHYGPTSEGKPAKTIEQIPLEWCYGEGIVIDMKHKRDFEIITKTDIENFLNQKNIDIKPGNIILIKTGRDKYIYDKDYYKKGTGMSAEATLFLIQKGVKVMGIDQWGWDLPLPYQIEQAKKQNRNDIFWEGHLVGIDHEYCHMEQLVNLEQLPYTGFKIACFPLKLKGASAGPSRVVAILE
ncbi:cyclase family protein [Flavobacterium covae]|uniref:cyclase family protein n=1 Tax=Flavobacterium covae TaxID=2906076 RepID=UPI00339A9360